jgi:misacylated tRNA(Ala) deacylase
MTTMPITEPLFQQDAYLRQCPARVVEVTPGGVVLDRTVFYPLGGGQPGDTGVLRTPDGRALRIVDTRKGEGGRILHLLAADATAPAVGAEVEASLDWERRYAHMRVHTCLHLLGSVLRYGVTGGQIAADKGRLDFDTQDEIDKERVSSGVNALIAANHRSSCARCPCSRRVARAASACWRSPAWTCSPAVAPTSPRPARSDPSQ